MGLIFQHTQQLDLVKQHWAAHGSGRNAGESEVAEILPEIARDNCPFRGCLSGNLGRLPRRGIPAAVITADGAGG